MSLKEKINEDMKSAMRSKDVALLGTIRLIQAAIKQKEVDERILVDDSSVISIIEKMLKQRNDSIEAFKKANRIDLVDKEEFEVSVLKNYMPEQMNAEEVEKIIQLSSFLAGGVGARGTPSIFVNEIFSPQYLSKAQIIGMLKK